MPQHTYHVVHRPPTVNDHMMAHSMGIAMAAWGAYTGLVSILTGVTSYTVSKALSDLPHLLIILIGLFLLVGSVGIISGLVDDSDDVVVGWRIERGGMTIAGTGWAAFFITTISTNFPATLSWTLALFILLGYFFRWRATLKSEKDIHSTMKNIIDHLHERAIEHEEAITDRAEVVREQDEQRARDDLEGESD